MSGDFPGYIRRDVTLPRVNRLDYLAQLFADNPFNQVCLSARFESASHVPIALSGGKDDSKNGQKMVLTLGSTFAYETHITMDLGLHAALRLPPVRALVYLRTVKFLI
jgi:hypothetical protein